MLLQNYNWTSHRFFLREVRIVPILIILAVSLVLFSSCEERNKETYFVEDKIVDVPLFFKDRFIETPKQEIFVPDFAYVDLEGNTHKFSEWKGKVVFLNFWAVWCEPCRYEMPDMEELYFNMKGKNFKMLALNVGEKPEKVTNFLKKFPYSFSIASDADKKIAESLKIEGLPTTLFVGTDGKILGKAVGPRKWSNKLFQAYFSQIGQH